MEQFNRMKMHPELYEYADMQEPNTKDAMAPISPSFMYLKPFCSHLAQVF
jgi:hypothetical protein